MKTLFALTALVIVASACSSEDSQTSNSSSLESRIVGTLSRPAMSSLGVSTDDPLIPKDAFRVKIGSMGPKQLVELNSQPNENENVKVIKSGIVQQISISVDVLRPVQTNCANHLSNTVQKRFCRAAVQAQGGKSLDAGLSFTFELESADVTYHNGSKSVWLFDPGEMAEMAR